MRVSEVKQLLFIGENPHAMVDDMVEGVGLSKAKIRDYLYKFREYGWVVKAPPRDREEGMNWELTSWGKKKLKDLTENLDIDLDFSKLHTYVPLGKRGDGRV